MEDIDPSEYAKWANMTPGDMRKLLRAEAFRRDGHRCVYCGSTERLTIDHLVPKSRGGSDTLGNVVCACFDCNNTRGNDPVIPEMRFAALDTPKPFTREYVALRQRRKPPRPTGSDRNGVRFL